MDTHNLSLHVNLDQELTPCETASERILEIALHAPAGDVAINRSPLNLALVLDRSGSMSGEKLEYVKQAARHVVGLLEEADRIALVDFDAQIRVLFPSALLIPDNRRALLSSINSIHSGGTTNLSGGWFTGCEQVAQAIKNGTINRTLLLTDGLANEGITDHEELATHARELARRGVYTSTFGVGAGFNHHLLEAMANQGEGRFYYIENPASIPGIFEKEFMELLTIFARNIEVVISYPPTVQVAILGEWSHDFPEPGTLRIYLGSLAAGRIRDLFIKMSIPSAQANTKVPIKICLRARGNREDMIEINAERSILMASREEAESAPKNEPLLKRYAEVELAAEAAAALKLEEEGRRREASARVCQSLEKHRDHIDADRERYYRNTSDQMLRGLDELDRKRVHSDSYTHKQKREEVPATLSVDPSIGHRTYQLEPHVKGHIIFNVDGRPVLLDTGSPVSFGRSNHWEFMGRQLNVPSDFMSITPDYLSQMIGVPIDFLLGMDVLKDLIFRINLRKGTIDFSNDPLPAGEWKFPLDLVMGVPYTEITMNGRARMVFIDSGAKIHYLRKDALMGLEAVDTERDFYPLLGEFETEVYELPIEIAGEVHKMRCGVLPRLLEMNLFVTSMQGILGTELFDKYIVSFDIPKQLMSLVRYPE